MALEYFLFLLQCERSDREREGQVSERIKNYRVLYIEKCVELLRGRG